MSEEKFNPNDHMMQLKGKSYLPVAARVMWFRQDHPIESGWGITTTLVEGGFKDGYAAFQCRITDPEGRVVGMGSNVEDKGGFGDFLMKAETGAIGRALAACGYGTMAAMDEGDIVDGPVERHATTANYPRPPEGVIRGCRRCGKPLTQAQAHLSTQKFGEPACPNCQKELAPIG